MAPVRIRETTGPQARLSERSSPERWRSLNPLCRFAGEMPTYPTQIGVVGCPLGKIHPTGTRRRSVTLYPLGVAVKSSGLVLPTLRFGVLEDGTRAGEFCEKGLTIRQRRAKRDPPTQKTRSSPVHILSRRIWSLILFVAPVFLSCPFVQGQSTYGSVAGFVTDPSGAAIVDAQVMLTKLGTAEKGSQFTVADGLYSF